MFPTLPFTETPVATGVKYGITVLESTKNKVFAASSTSFTIVTAGSDSESPLQAVTQDIKANQVGFFNSKYQRLVCKRSFRLRVTLPTNTASTFATVQDMRGVPVVALKDTTISSYRFRQMVPASHT